MKVGVRDVDIKMMGQDSMLKLLECMLCGYFRYCGLLESKICMCENKMGWGMLREWRNTYTR